MLQSPPIESVRIRYRADAKPVLKEGQFELLPGTEVVRETASDVRARNQANLFGVNPDDVKSRAHLITRDAYEGSWGHLLQKFDSIASQQFPDPYTQDYTLGLEAGVTPVNSTLAPTYNPYDLMRLPLQNNTLLQCIAAMQTNIDGFGYTLEYIGPKDQEESTESKEEWQRLSDLIDQPNADESFSDIREKLRADYETVGYWALEIGRDENGNIMSLHHSPAFSFRMTRRDAEPTEYNVWLRREGKLIEQKMVKHFRRIIQMVGGKKRFFKEFGDPRNISPETGDPDPNLAQDQCATEVLMNHRYVPGEVYGQPRWINQLPSILGSRESEVTNLQFFKDNAIPALAVLVSGGLLTNQAVKDIERAFKRETGSTAMHRVLVMEAQGVSDLSRAEPQSPSTPKLDIKPLAGERQQDGLFQTYDENNQKKVRSSFRLPPIFIGLTEDYTRATVEASLQTADNQVFSPERIKTDKIVNAKLLLYDGKPPIYWRYRSNPAKLVSSDSILSSLKQFEEVGAMTPNLAISMANEMLDLHIPKIKEEWGNMPFEFVRQLIATGKLRPQGVDSLPAGLQPDDANNGGQGGATIDKKAQDIRRSQSDISEIRNRVRKLEDRVDTTDIRLRKRAA